MRILTSLILTVITFQSSTWAAFQLSEPAVLLPVLDETLPPVQYEISVNEGCFSWSSLESDIVRTVNPSNKCGSSVIIEVVWKKQARASTSIIAQHDETGQILRCDVFVTPIASINVETRSRVMYLDDAPEILTAAAYDANGNRFTSLGRQPIKWSYTPEDCKPVKRFHSPISPLSFESSAYNASADILAVESKGKTAATTLVQALKTGRVCVTAEVDYFRNTITSPNILLTVVEHVALRPLSALLVPGVTLWMKVRMDKTTVSGLTDLKDTPYQLSVQNTSILTHMQPLEGQIKAREIGSTSVFLSDDAKLFESAEVQPRSLIEVADPTFLRLHVETCSAHADCVLEIGRQYEMKLDLTTSSGQVFDVSENSEVKFTIGLNRNNFEVVKVYGNGMRALVRVIGKPALSTGEGTYHGIIGKSNTKSLPSLLRCTKRIQTVSPIKLDPETALVPLTTKPVTVSCFKPSGGTGNFHWKSENTKVTQVDQNGFLTPKEIGEGFVSISDVVQHLHSASGQVIVTNPAGIRVDAEPTFSAKVGTSLKLRATLVDRQGREFTLCKFDQFEWQLHDRNTFKAPAKNTGREAQFLARKEGISNVTVKWLNVQKTVSIDAYRQLEPISNFRKILVSYKASVDVAFEGGFLTDAGHTLTTEVSVANTETKIFKPTILGSYNVRLQCTQIGCQNLTATVTSERLPTNPEHSSFEFCCQHPSALTFDETESVAQLLKTCQLQRKKDDKDLIVADTAQVPVKVVPSWKGRSYHNASTLKYDWKIDQTGKPISTKPLAKKLLDNELAESNAIVSVNGYIGRSSVIVTVAEHNKPVKMKLPEPVSVDRFLDSRGPLELSKFPERFLNHHKVSSSSVLKGGSGTYTITSSEHVATSLTEGRLEVRPVTAGQAEVVVSDKCIYPALQLKAKTRVSDIYRLSVFTESMVQQNDVFAVKVCAFDTQDKEYTSEEYELLSVDLVVSQGLELAESSQGSRPVVKHGNVCKGTVFHVKAVSAGDRTLRPVSFHRTMKDARYEGPDSHVQVFLPLLIDPSDILIMPGSCVYVQTTGGPTDGTLITRFEVENNDISRVSEDARLCAISPGKTTIRAYMMSHPDCGPASTRKQNPDLNCYIVAEDTATVEVAKMTDMHIVLPVTKMVEATELTVHVVPRHNKREFLLGSTRIPMRWASTNPDVASPMALYQTRPRDVSIFHDTEFVGQLRAGRAGQATVSVSTPCDPAIMVCRKGQTVSTKVTVEVLPPLEIRSGTRLLLPFGCTYQIRTNYDVEGVVTFRTETPHSGSSEAPFSVFSTGAIHTNAAAGSGVIRVTANLKGLEQYQLIDVEVATPVHLSMFPTSLPDGAIMTPEGGQSSCQVPVGSSITFDARLHDRNGRYFDFIDTSMLRIPTHTIPILRVTESAQTNGSISIQATGSGREILMVSYQGHSVSHALRAYIHLTAISAIIPFSPVVHINQKIPFSMSSSPQEKGVWSTNSKLMSITSDGKASIKSKPGDASITYSTKSTTTSAPVLIRKAAKVTVGSEALKLATAVENEAQTFDFPVEMFTADGDAFSSLPVSDKFSRQQFRFACRISPKSAEGLIKVKPEYDVENDVYNCKATVVSGKPKPNPVTLTKFSIVAEVTDREGSYKVIGESAAIAFIPAIKLASHEVKMSTSHRGKFTVFDAFKHELELSLDAVPLNHVETNPDTWHGDNVVVSKKNIYGNKYDLEFNFDASHTVNSTFQFQLISKTTHQVVTVSITPTSGASSQGYSLMFTIIIGLALFIAFYYYGTSWNSESQASAFGKSSTMNESSRSNFSPGRPRPDQGLGQ